MFDSCPPVHCSDKSCACVRAQADTRPVGIVFSRNVGDYDGKADDGKS